MPDYGSLEGGWDHIPMDPMAFITELLTPRNVQRGTIFAGGSHYGPDRNASIPAENFAQAKALLELMGQKDAQERGSEMGGLADDVMRRRVEAERTNLSPGSITMGGVETPVEGKIGVQTPMSDAERSLLEAGGYPDTRMKTGYGSGVVDPSKQTTADAKQFEQAREYLGQLMQERNLAQTEEEAAQLAAEIDQVKAFLNRSFGGGPAPTAVEENKEQPIRTGDWARGLANYLGSFPAGG